MLSFSLFIAFLITFWMGIYYSTRSFIAARQLFYSLIMASASLIFTLLAINFEEITTVFWRNSIIFFVLLFLFSFFYSNDPFKRKQTIRPSYTSRLASIITYVTAIALCSMVLIYLNQVGSLYRISIPLAIEDRTLSLVYSLLGVMVVFLTIATLSINHYLDSPLHKRNNLPSLMAMSGLGFLGIVPLITLFSEDLAKLTLSISLFITPSCFLLFQPLRSHFSWNKRLVSALEKPILYSFYIGISAVIVWWILENGLFKFPLIVALSVSSVFIGLFEIFRLKISTKYLKNYIVQESDSDYVYMARTIQRAISDYDLFDLLQYILNLICERKYISKGFIALFDESNRLVIRAVHNVQSVNIGDVIEQQFAVHQEDETNADKPITNELSLKFPLEIRSKQMGILAISHPATGEIEEVEQLIQNLVQQLSLAVENFQLKLQIRNDLRKLAQESETLLNRQTSTRGSLHSTFLEIEGKRQTIHKIKVNCLGQFSAEIDKRTIEGTEWGNGISGNRHTKSIFALLVANRERLVRRDELIETIWGDEADLNILSNRLDRTISTLRRVLEPNLRRGANSNFIITDMNGYRLNPTIEWLIDYEKFVQLYCDAKAFERRGDKQSALERYLQAETLYKGDYMIDCPFLDRNYLIYTTREALRVNYLDLLVKIARLYAAAGFPEMEIQYLEMATIEDQFREDLYQQLINSYCASQRYIEAVSTCKNHQKVLSDADMNCGKLCFSKDNTFASYGDRTCTFTE